MSRWTNDELEIIIAEKAEKNAGYAIAYALARVAHEIHRCTWEMNSSLSKMRDAQKD